MGRQRPGESATRVTDRSFETARAFRLKRRVSDEEGGRETVEVEEGGLGDAFAIGACEGPASTKSCQQRRSNRGRIPETIEAVVPKRKVARNRAGVRAPLGGDGLVSAAAVLVVEPAWIARMEALAESALAAV